MKTSLLLFSVFTFLFANKRNGIFIENFSIGKHVFSIYKEEKFLHDDNLNAEFFVVYANNKKQSFCSSFLKTIRNDTVFKKGNYILERNRLIFKEFNFYQHENESDSLIKIFHPDKNGNLKLVEVLNYKNGIVDQRNYQ